jgi:hypothetical protein
MTPHILIDSYQHPVSIFTFTLTMEAVYFESLVTIYQSTRCHPEDSKRLVRDVPNHIFQMIIDSMMAVYLNVFTPI